jgi:hypothetical protein
LVKPFLKEQYSFEEENGLVVEFVIHLSLRINNIAILKVQDLIFLCTKKAHRKEYSYIIRKDIEQDTDI